MWRYSIGTAVRRCACPGLAGWRLPKADRQLLMDHTAFGCLGVWCRTPAGGQPLIFRRRWIKRCVPCAHLIYCRSLETLEMAAPAIGRMLSSRGMPLLLVPTNRPLRRVPGRFFPDKLPVYCRGEPAPPIGDPDLHLAGDLWVSQPTQTV